LEPRKTSRTAAGLARGGEALQPPPEIDRRLLEDLLQDLTAPGEARVAALVDTGGGGALPAVEGVDEIEAGPRHANVGIRLPGLQTILHDSKRLVEAEPRRPGVSPQVLLLRSGRLQREAHRRVAFQRAHPDSSSSETANASNET